MYQLHGGPRTLYMNSPDSSWFSLSCASCILSFSSSFYFFVKSCVMMTLLNGALASRSLFRFWKTSLFLFSSFMVTNNGLSLPSVTLPSVSVWKIA